MEAAGDVAVRYSELMLPLPSCPYKLLLNTSGVDR
jgi:hypothetical protein